LLFAPTAVVFIWQVPAEDNTSHEKAPIVLAAQATSEGFAAEPAAEQFVPSVRFPVTESMASGEDAVATSVPELVPRNIWELAALFW
jgi:hypothetical protein